jgi:3-dehydroquinate dehydratase
MLLLKKEVKTPVSYHANGKAGMLSRIINPLLGGQIAFCVDHYTEASVMEQINLRAAATVVQNVKKITEA